MKGDMKESRFFPLVSLSCFFLTETWRGGGALQLYQWYYLQFGILLLRSADSPTKLTNCFVETVENFLPPSDIFPGEETPLHFGILHQKINSTIELPFRKAKQTVMKCYTRNSCQMGMYVWLFILGGRKKWLKNRRAEKETSGIIEVIDTNCPHYQEAPVFWSCPLANHHLYALWKLC